MPIYKRQELPKLLSEVKQGLTSQIYLIWGERYLCRSAAQDLIDHLLPEKNRHSTSLHHIDGDQEDFNKTLNLLKTFSLFSGPQIIRVTDSKLFYSKIRNNFIQFTYFILSCALQKFEQKLSQTKAIQESNQRSIRHMIGR